MQRGHLAGEIRRKMAAAVSDSDILTPSPCVVFLFERRCNEELKAGSKSMG